MTQETVAAPANTESALSDLDAWTRVPGLFHRWELMDVVEPAQNYFFEWAGEDAGGASLFAIYFQEPSCRGIF